MITLDHIPLEIDRLERATELARLGKIRNRIQRLRAYLS